MFQDDLLLAQLKQQLHSQTPRAEEVVKATKRSFGFLEVSMWKGYFIPPSQMKKVMHSGRVVAVIHSEEGRESAEPEELVEPFLTRLVGKVQGKNDRLATVPDHPFLKDAIPCRAARGLNHEFEEGDWAAVEMCRHPLKDNRSFYAELAQYITFGNDHFIPWWVTLVRHNLEKEAPNGVATGMLDEGLVREDLTALDFVTIDSAGTEDIDDTLFAKALPGDKLQLIVAITDPTAWIARGSKLDKAAKVRAFTNCLSGFSIPMLPRELSDGLCSLRTNETRPVLVCRVTLSAGGTIEDNIEFFATTVEPKAKPVYDRVPDWLENTGNWQPESEAVAEQVRLLAQTCQHRDEWRHNHTLVFKDRPDCHFILGKKGGVLDIVAKPCHIANRIVEEAMIAVDICVARVLRDKLGLGIYNVHMGFDPANTDTLTALPKTHGLHVDAEEMLTLDGLCKLRRELDAQSASFFGSRTHHFQSFVEISTELGPHFDLGLEAYITWTSPIRKYGDTVNHRLLKADVRGKTMTRLQDEIAVQMAERRRLNRMAERNADDWLYVRFLKDKVRTDTRFTTEIIDTSRGGMHVRLADSGAIVFILAPFLHAVCDELVCSQENGTIQIKGEMVYRVTDAINVTIAEVRMKTRSVIAHLIAWSLFMAYSS